MNLFDTTPIRLQVVERANASDRMTIRGEFGRCDVPTANRRIYGRQIIESNIAALQADISRRRALGELDHPDDGRTMLKRVSHVITRLEVDENGVVIGEAEILNTPHGQALRAIIEANCEVGVSSRGTGSTATNKDGMDEVQSDFVLRTYDFVFDPAMKTAYPQQVRESIEQADKTVMAEGYTPPDDVASVVLDESQTSETDPATNIREVVKRLNKDKTLEVDNLQSGDGPYGVTITGTGTAIAHVAIGSITRGELKFWGAKDRLSWMVMSGGKTMAEGQSPYSRLDSLVAAIEAAIKREIASASPRPVQARDEAADTAALVAALQEDLQAARDLIRSHEQEIERAKSDLREMQAMRLRDQISEVIQSAVKGQPKRAALLRIIGSSASFRSVAEATERVRFVVSEFGEPARDLEAELAQASQSLRDAAQDKEKLEKLSQDLENVRVENQMLRNSLEEAGQTLNETNRRLEEAVSIGIKLHDHLDISTARFQAASSLIGRTDATRIISLIESAQAVNEITGIMKANPARHLTEAEVDSVRARVRRGMENMGPIAEETEPRPGARNRTMVHDLTEADFRRLSGIPD